jgi:C-terminal processing protease CtpA/Prc
MGMELDEDKDGNVFVKSIDAGGRAEKSGKVFVGDYVKMVSATFGDDMWTCEGVGLTRVLSCIKVRNTKPVAFVLQAKTPEEERKRRAIAYAEPSEEEKAAKKAKDEELMQSMLEEDKSLLKKRKGLFGLW